MEHSKNFEKYRRRWERNGCTIKQLHRLAELGAIYSWEFTKLTGQEF